MELSNRVGCDKLLKKKLEEVKLRIGEATLSNGRSSDDVKLVAVSKKVSAERILQAIQLGQKSFGENYVQEAVEKIKIIHGIINHNNLQVNPEWHFIGQMQSNKAKTIAQLFDWVHTVDRLKIAKRLSDARGELQPKLNICIQVNTSHEVTKGGVKYQDVPALVRDIEDLPNLEMRGFMTIPSKNNFDESVTKQFRRLKKLMDDFSKVNPRIDTLSMGMSRDLDIAISSGANLVRVGTAIFGIRGKS